MLKHRIHPLAVAVAMATSLAAAPSGAAAPTTPIQHLVVIVGENHTFDNLFATLGPTPTGSVARNLLTQRIILPDGSPGPNFAAAAQSIADPRGVYTIDPSRTGAYALLPQPDTTYATGQLGNIPDPRFPANLPNGPFQITNYAAYSDFVGDPVHRFFQMWQQVGAGRHDLFTWVDNTAGIGNHNDGFGNGPGNQHQGGVAMGFYNVNAGDAPMFRQMAQRYAISDNYHQAIMGGTGANFLAIATADVGFFTDGNGNLAVPTYQGNGTTTGAQIDNPTPQANSAGNPNWYAEDGYRGGSYVECADPAQPGVAPILARLGQVSVAARCDPGHYYLVNNYNLGYLANGAARNLATSPYTLPPLPAALPTIADQLSAAGVSWKWYSGGRGDGTHTTPDYCGICDPFTGFTSVMTDPTKIANLQDATVLVSDIQNGTLPSVSFVRPPESMAGHPANATLALYEDYVTNVINLVRANPALWGSTAILITTDEGGGYFDSGYVQLVDFFGDGTRIPMIAVSPWAREGYIDHTYTDHASIAKFIEHNWGLAPLSARSRDNLPNPVQADGSYVPSNAPAIGDLFNLFDFTRMREDAPAIQVGTFSSQ